MSCRNMFEKVKALRLQYRKAQSEAEEQAIQLALDRLRAEDPEAWAWAMVENAKETAEEAKALKEEKALPGFSLKNNL